MLPEDDWIPPAAELVFEQRQTDIANEPARDELLCQTVDGRSGFVESIPDADPLLIIRERERERERGGGGGGGEKGGG